MPTTTPYPQIQTTWAPYASVVGYAWGAFEAYWICLFLGVRVSIATAVAIEIMSVSIDALFFMVPAKIGTQEGGKTIIFTTLGLPATLGFAFGVVRHVRELLWAAFGLLLSATHRAPVRRARASA